MPRDQEEGIAARVARRLGLTFTDTVVLYTGTNVLVHLTPAPVVARVTRIAHLVRPVTDLAGAIALARADAVRRHVVAPTTFIDPGPHVEDSRYVTFWMHYAGGPNTPLATPTEAGSSLRLFHESARDHEGLLRNFDPRPEAMKIADLVEPDIGAILRAAAGSMTRPDVVQQPIHGDAHEENALAGASGRTSMMSAPARSSGISPASSTGDISSASARQRSRPHWAAMARMTNARPRCSRRSSCSP